MKQLKVGHKVNHDDVMQFCAKFFDFLDALTALLERCLNYLICFINFPDI